MSIVRLPGSWPGRILAGAGILIAVALVFSSWYTVDEGERAVVLRNGAYVGTSGPGLHFKIPIIDSYARISTQDHVAIYELEAYSRDQQPATMKVSVSYRLLPDRVPEIYRVYGSREGIVDRLLTRKTLEETKTVFGQFNAETSIRERGRLNSEVAKQIQSGVDGPMVVLGVQIEDIKFSSAYEGSVEQRMLAEVQVQREQQNLAREKVLADIIRTQALAEADKVREGAKARAEATRLQGDAEAAAIEARGKALRDNPKLVELVQAERWNGVLPTTVLPNTAVPLLVNR